MKKSLYLIILTFLVLISTSSITPVLEMENDHFNAESVAIHPFDLNEGVDQVEFEKYMVTELLPIYSSVIGQEAFLLKGDRGKRTGLYAVMLTFDDVAKRNEIYPPEGGISKEFDKANEGKDAIWDKLDLYVKGGFWQNHTDYNKVIPGDE